MNETKVCPSCGVEIISGAVQCRFCQQALNQPEVEGLLHREGNSATPALYSGDVKNMSKPPQSGTGKKKRKPPFWSVILTVVICYVSYQLTVGAFEGTRNQSFAILVSIPFWVIPIAVLLVSWRLWGPERQGGIAKYFLIDALWITIGYYCARKLLSQILESQAGHLETMEVALVGLSLVMCLFIVLFKAAKWKVLLRPIGRISVMRLFGAISSGRALSVYLPFRLDVLVRAFSVARLSKISFAQTLGSVAVEQLIDLLFLGIVLVVFALLFSITPGPSLYLGVGVSFALIVCSLGLSSRLSRVRWIRSDVAHQFSLFSEGGSAVRIPKSLMLATAFALGEWASTVMMIYAVAEASGIAPTSLPSMVMATALLFLSHSTPRFSSDGEHYKMLLITYFAPLVSLSDEFKRLTVSMSVVVHMMYFVAVSVCGVIAFIVLGERLTTEFVEHRLASKKMAPRAPKW